MLVLKLSGKFSKSEMTNAEILIKDTEGQTIMLNLILDKKSLKGTLQIHYKRWEYFGNKMLIDYSLRVLIKMYR